MSASYTYWQDPKDGMWLGYWNDYPDYRTQGTSLDDLKYMLADLRSGIHELISDGLISEAEPCSSGVMELA